MTQRDTYTPEQVAEIANVTRRTVYRWIKSEALPAHKIGPKMWLVYRQVLAAFMAGKDAERLHNMAASLQGRKTVMTPAPLPGPISAPSSEVEDPDPDPDEEMSDEEAEEFLEALRNPGRFEPSFAEQDRRRQQWMMGSRSFMKHRANAELEVLSGHITIEPDPDLLAMELASKTAGKRLEPMKRKPRR